MINIQIGRIGDGPQTDWVVFIIIVLVEIETSTTRSMLCDFES